jgi:anti-anti-sigma regulatory factor
MPAESLVSLEPGAPTDAALALRTEDDTVYAQGILDAETSALLLNRVDQLQRAGRSRIRLDLIQVVRIDSAAIRVLFDQQNALTEAGGDLELIVSTALRPRLSLCRLEPVQT